MLETLFRWVSEYGDAIKSNPALALFAVYFTGVGTYLLRNVPTKLYHFLMTQGTTVLELDNSGHEGNALQYNSFINWYSQSKWFKQSRSIFLGGHGSNSMSGEVTKVFGPGSGFHFFFVGLRPFWFNISSMESSSSEKIKKKINVRTFGRSHDSLNTLIKEFEYKDIKHKGLSIDYWKDNYERWESHVVRVQRDMNTVIINKETKDDIIQKIKDFQENKQWYLDRNIPYKLSLLFHGNPGGGKTSIAKAIASMMNRNLFLLDPSTMTNQTLMMALSAIPPGSCLLVEDIDASTKAVLKRADGNEVPSDEVANMSGVGKLTLSGLLNALDGVIELNDVVVLTTTNHIERLDPALVRKSRIDHTYLIGELTYIEAREYLCVMYPESKDLATLITESNFKPMPGCDVQAIFKDNPHDALGFIQEITKSQHLELVGELKNGTSD